MNYFSPNGPVSYSKIASKLNRHVAVKGQREECDKLLQATKEKTETRLATPAKGFFFRSPKSFIYLFINPNKIKAEGLAENVTLKKMALKRRFFFRELPGPQEKGLLQTLSGSLHFHVPFKLNPSQVKSSQCSMARCGTADHQDNESSSV